MVSTKKKKKGWTLKEIPSVKRRKILCVIVCTNFEILLSCFVLGFLCKDVVRFVGSDVV